MNGLRSTGSFRAPYPMYPQSRGWDTSPGWLGRAGRRAGRRRPDFGGLVPSGSSFQAPPPDYFKPYPSLPGGAAFQAELPYMMAANRALTGPFPGRRTRTRPEIFAQQGGMTRFHPSGVAAGTSIDPRRAGLPDIGFEEQRWPAYQQELEDEAIAEDRRRIVGMILGEAADAPKVFDRQGVGAELQEQYQGLGLTPGMVDPRVINELVRRGTLRRYAQGLRAMTGAAEAGDSVGAAMAYPGTYVGSLSPGEQRLPSSREMLQDEARAATEGGDTRLADYLEQRRAERLEGPRSRLAGLAAFRRQQQEAEMGGPMTIDTWLAMQHPEIGVAQQQRLGQQALGRAQIRSALGPARISAETEADKLALEREKLADPLAMFLSGLGGLGQALPETVKEYFSQLRELSELMQPIEGEVGAEADAPAAQRRRRLLQNLARKAPPEPEAEGEGFEEALTSAIGATVGYPGTLIDKLRAAREYPETASALPTSQVTRLYKDAAFGRDPAKKAQALRLLRKEAAKGNLEAKQALGRLGERAESQYPGFWERFLQMKPWPLPE